MKPEEIEGRDFLVGLRGYDKDEVRSFLGAVAAEHASLLAELESVQAAPAAAPVGTAPASDDFDNFGSGVASILRAAKDSAAEITAEAEAVAANLRAQAESIRDNASEAADGLRAEARRVLDDARGEAERIVREAMERAQALEIETEARVRNRVDGILAEADARIAEAQSIEDGLRSRLAEAQEELQLALIVLSDVSPNAIANLRDEAAQMVADGPGAESERITNVDDSLEDAPAEEHQVDEHDAPAWQ